MSYSSTIDKSLIALFKQLKDLAIAATVTRKTVGDFDFNNPTNSSNNLTTIPVEIVVIQSSEKISKDDKRTLIKEIMLKSKDIGTMTAYDTILIKNVTWRVGSIIKDDGFLKMLQITKEA